MQLINAKRMEMYSNPKRLEREGTKKKYLPLSLIKNSFPVKNKQECDEIRMDWLVFGRYTF